MNGLKELFSNQKLNKKFTFVIILFAIIPFGILSAILFYLMERNVVNENMSYMEYNMQRNQDYIGSKIDAIHMSTQFFLSDKDLWNVLDQSSKGADVSTEEWYDIKNTNVVSLERLVNSNPLLYSVRIYAQNDNVLEMFPIVYRNSRLQQQAWAVKNDPYGWNYNYVDNISGDSANNQEHRLIGLVTPVYNGYNEQIGTIEACMSMENMLPSLYENIEDEGSYFYADNGGYYLDENNNMLVAKTMSYLSGQIPAEGEDQVIYMEVEEQNLIVSYMPIKEIKGTLISVKDISTNIQELHNVRTIFLIVMVLFIIVMALFVDQITKHMLKQFYVILHSIREVKNGNLDVRIENCGKDEMGELGTQINEMMFNIKELMEDNLKREILVKNSEIKALQNQINAHFIYNVLESIKMMAEINEEYEISDSITSLGKLLRYSMKWVSGNVIVEEELEYIKNYMALINLRFDYEIYLSLNIPELIMKQEIPKMSLQPIVENAIYHGIEQMAEDTNIYIKGFLEENDCIIEITDMGKGMSEEDVENLYKKIAGEIDSRGGSGNGIGLKNVQDRMHIAFGEEYGIEIASRLGCYTKIIVRIPITHPNVLE